MCGFGTPATKGLQPLIQVMASFPIPPSPSWQHGEPVYDPTDPTCFCIASCSSCLQAQGWCKPRTPTTVRHNALLAWNRRLQDQSILKWIQHAPNTFLRGYIQHSNACLLHARIPLSVCTKTSTSRITYFYFFLLQCWLGCLGYLLKKKIQKKYS